MTSTEIALPSEQRAAAYETIDPGDAEVIAYLGLDPRNAAHRAQVAVCRHYDLDAVLKHVVVIPRGGVYITRDGLLHIAHRSGQLDGIVVEQEPALSDDGKEWVARVSVYRKDMTHPFTYPGRYPVAGSNKDYAQEMAMKAAEAHALRRAFSVTGLPTADEQRPAAEPHPQAPEADTVSDPVHPEPDESQSGKPDDSRFASGSITQAQSKKMFAQFGELGISEQDEYRAYIANVLGHDVETSKDLSKAEAAMVIESQIADLETRA